MKLGPVVSKTQYDKVMAAIDAGKATNAQLVTGGRRPEGMDKGYYIAPTIFADVPTDAAIWREEIFGPVVCINPFDTEAEALQLAKRQSLRAGRCCDVQRSGPLRTGGRQSCALGIIWINCSQPTFAQVPWGGYKSSGIGRELGTAGIYGLSRGQTDHTL